MNNRILFVGDFQSQKEEQSGIPLFGAPGKELERMCTEARLDVSAAKYVNALAMRPPNDDIQSICLSRAAAVYTYLRKRDELVLRYPQHTWPTQYDWPALVGANSFLHPEHLSHLADLQDTILAHDPSLIVGMGHTAAWALLRSPNIGKLRGYSYPCALLPGGPRVIPTYHPSSILRMYSNRPVLVADLQKAARAISRGYVRNEDLHDPNIRIVWLSPTLEDLEAWERLVAPDDMGSGPNSESLAVDIETFAGTITCIGFGTSRLAICVPFWDKGIAGGNYWATPEEEVAALRWVEKMLHHPCGKVLQNAQYDLQYLWRTWRMVPKGTIEDTMLMAHALQPEMEKSLNFLGSAYADVPQWKNLRKISDLRKKKETKDV